MRMIFGLVLVAGLALAGAAVYLANGYFSGQKRVVAELAQRASQVVPTVDVVVLAKPIDYGAVLRPEHLATLRWPAAGVPSGAFTDIEALLAEEDPRLVLRRMEAGEPLMAVKVTAPGEDAGLGSRLGQGMRAFTVSVNETSGVSGFLRPDDRVDVYWTGQGPEGRSVTRLIEPGMRIMAVDQETNSNRTGARVARTVTFEVTPRQVAALTQATASGSLTMSLVGHGDDVVLSEAIEVDRNGFLGVVEAEPMAPIVAEAKPEVCTIRTRKGAEVITIPIPCTN